MSPEQVRAWVDTEWQRVLEEAEGEPDPDIDRFVNSNIVSLRYAFVTQLLGKAADPARSLMCLQRSSSEKGAWDARSFSTAVIVPWVADNHNVLGTSAEPYVSKPLRRARLDSGMSHLRNKAQWQALADFFVPLENERPEAIEEIFRRCLRSLARRLARQKFKYPIPKRVGMNDLDGLLKSFLGTPSRGLRPLAASVALMRTLGDAFSLFSSVKSQGLNEADAAGGMPGDIVCYGRDKKVALVVEVKDYELTVADLRASVRKAHEAEDRLSNLLFAVPGIKEQDRNEIETRIRSTWASGLNVYRVDIETLAGTTFVLLDEEWRTKFLKEIGEELDTRGEHRHREAWRRLLSELGEKS